MRVKGMSIKNKRKYPRTIHCKESPGKSLDDIAGLSAAEYLDKWDEYVITEKLDGECTTLYSDYIHARSIDSSSHPSQSWIRNAHSKIAYLIPENVRVCGENLYAKHSIGYEELQSFFFIFSIVIDDVFQPWNVVEEYSSLLGFPTVPVIYRGNEKKTPDSIIKRYNIDLNTTEGFVYWNNKHFHVDDFSHNVFKWVRTEHVKTNKHWKSTSITLNKLRKS